MPALELKGLRVGRLKVLYKTSKKDKQGNNYWMCKCDCRNLVEVRASTLNKKIIRSCGCSRVISIAVGLRAGKLIAIEKSRKDKNSSVVWKCLCDCGNYCYVRASSLKSGSVKSCGCLHAERMKQYEPPNRKTYGEASRNALITKYKISAAARNKEFSLSNGECEDLFKSNCYYCDKKPSQIFKPEGVFGEYIYNGIDRVINEEGYFTERTNNFTNVVSCCIQCNERKQAFTYNEFLNHVNTIYSKLSKIKQIVCPLISIDKNIIDRACDFEKVNFIKTHSRMIAPGIANRNALIHRYKGSAKDRKLSFSLTKEEATFLFKSNCYYCEISPYQVYFNKGSNGPFIYTGIDRVDNNRGYEKDNVVPCCKRCNSWKKALTYDQFRAWVIKVHENICSKQLALIT